MTPLTVEPPYGPGAICDDCGHFAGRHDEDGCHTDDLEELGIRDEPCPCPMMLWLGVRWPRPWEDHRRELPDVR